MRVCCGHSRYSLPPTGISPTAKFRSTNGSKDHGQCSSAIPPTSPRCVRPNWAAPPRSAIGEVTGSPLNFPIVADPDRTVAELYDMIHPGAGDTSTVRSVFIVDPDNKLRMMLTYPKSVGRNFDEIIRVLDALQATDRDPIATPADWRPGDRVVVSPSVSTDDAKQKFDNVEEVKPYLRYADAPTT